MGVKGVKPKTIGGEGEGRRVFRGQRKACWLLSRSFTRKVDCPIPAPCVFLGTIDASDYL